ncbi:MAG: response regulator [Candidatus Omnitrophica bacterium]|nr:response regulator [Candidatus Omnitrophota bacterium]MCM8826785.1 response regulator [Candidatus Omnitrophota bacterium]
MDKLTKKILVVDDEEEMLLYIGNILRRANYDVLTANKGKDAIEMANNYRPDLIILDIVMPDMQGGEVAAALSRNLATVNIPIMFLTGLLVKKEEGVLDKIRGKHYILAKPVTSQELLKTVNELING